ncbi:hypothetical protein ANN_04248 [Periplaneta americana]|uniref:Uncharacterized protein n=1 Tax=Periplaneta americana TaxID=6978 RepID=A0ABQ8T820_PERAM|nr:hypothetical protein ANN_04248 [Periplaneta americana]
MPKTYMAYDDISKKPMLNAVFSACKVILSDTRRSFSCETLKMNVVVYCSRNRNQAYNMQEKVDPHIQSTVTRMDLYEVGHPASASDRARFHLYTSNLISSGARSPKPFPSSSDDSRVDGDENGDDGADYNDSESFDCVGGVIDEKVMMMMMMMMMKKPGHPHRLKKTLRKLCDAQVSQGFFTLQYALLTSCPLVSPPDVRATSCLRLLCVNCALASNIFLSILFSNTLNLCSSLQLFREQTG